MYLPFSAECLGVAQVLKKTRYIVFGYKDLKVAVDYKSYWESEEIKKLVESRSWRECRRKLPNIDSILFMSQVIKK